MVQDQVVPIVVHTNGKEVERGRSLHRSLGRRNIWKEPPTRYAKGSARSPSPFAKGQVAFKFGVNRLDDGDSDDNTQATEGSDEEFVENQLRRLRSQSSLKVRTQEESLALAYSYLSGEQRRVSFSTVTVHSHLNMLGDNPSVSSGVPLTMEWNALSHKEMTVDLHQAKKRGETKSAPQLKMGQVRRELILKALGYDPIVLRNVAQDIKQQQILRKEGIHVFIETAVAFTNGRVPGGKAPSWLRGWKSKCKADACY